MALLSLFDIYIIQSVSYSNLIILKFYDVLLLEYWNTVVKRDVAAHGG